MKFSYLAYSSTGGKVTGVIEADNYKEAALAIKSRDLSPIKIDEEQDEKQSFLIGSKKLTNKEKELFTNQFSLLLGNKLKLDKALSLIEKTTPSIKVKKMVGELLSSVKSGVELSTALENTKEFDSIYINLVRIGESSGNLASVMQGLARDLKFKSDLTAKVKQAMAYPIMIMIFCFFAILFIFNFIVPKMSVLFEGADNLPVYTVILLETTDLVVKYQYFIIALIPLIAFLMTDFGIKFPRFTKALESVKLTFPFIKDLIKQVESIRFCSSMSMCLANGVLLEKALSLSIKSVSVNAYQKQLLNSYNNLKSGTSLTESLALGGLLNDLQNGLVEIGEESGDLTTVFEEITARSRDDFESWINKFTSLLEPLLIMMMGLIVGVIVVVMLMSIVSVQDIGL